jgi:hypothetical protein
MEAKPVVGKAGFGTANKLLFVFLQGGPSHIDIWDPKPESPEYVRGEFKAIATSVPGIQVTEIMPKLARVLNRATLIRSCSYSPTGLFDHSAAIYEVLTGHVPETRSMDGELEPPSTADMPTAGSNVVRFLPALDRKMSFYMLPAPVGSYSVAGKGATGGFYGSSFGPYLLGNDLLPETGTIRDDEGMVRESFLPQRARQALQLNHESETVRDSYGRNPFGTALLRARRLLESGSRVVQVNWPYKADGRSSKSLDTHKDTFKALSTIHGPMLDSGLSALIEDLDARGLLHETLVLVIGEFGRSPKLGVSTSGNATAPDGRDHWPYCFTALMAGGGIARGAAYGKSDAVGAYPVENAIHPAQLLATAYYALGVDPGSKVVDRVGRTHRLVHAEPVLNLFA